MGGVVERILSVPPAAALTVIFLLPALEASVFLGFVVPGETALVVGGVLAQQHRLPLAAVLAAGVTGAIIGDSVGYWVGLRWGLRLLERVPTRLLRPTHVQAGQNAIRRMGGKAVFVGRFTAVLRAIVPGLCGVARMTYRRTFLPWNVAGGLLWASAVVLVGYLAGASWQLAAQRLALGGWVLVAVVGVVAVGAVLVHRWRRRRAERTLAALVGRPHQPGSDPS